MLKAVLTTICLFSLLVASGWAQDASPRATAQFSRILGANPTTGAPSNFLDIFTDGSLACRAGDLDGNLFTSHLVSGTDRSLDVDVRHSALPDGAATEETLDSLLAEAQSIDSKFDVNLSTRASESTLSSFATQNHTDLLGVQTRLDTVNSNLVTIQSKQDTGNASLASIDGKIANNYGAASGAVRTASQIGNSTGAADFGAGATGAQTLRTASNLYDGSANAITSRSYDSTRPLDAYLPQVGANTVTYTRTTLTANTSTQIIAANAARKWLYIDNQSGANVFVKFGATAVINQALEVSNGTTFKMSLTELYLGAINAIVGSNNRTVEVVEGF